MVVPYPIIEMALVVVFIESPALSSCVNLRIQRFISLDFPERAPMKIRASAAFVDFAVEAPNFGLPVAPASAPLIYSRMKLPAIGY